MFKTSGTLEYRTLWCSVFMGGMRAFRLVLAVVIALLALTAAPAHPWHGSGSITSLAIDAQTPTTLYAGTCDRGVFKSTDGGATWSATGLTNLRVFSLAIDPQMPTTVYAGAGGWDCSGAATGTGGPGVHKSTDGGTSWSGIGLTGLPVNALAIDPGTPTTLYAGTDWGGVLKSMDGGATWNQTGPVLFNTALAIDPMAPGTIYAADASFFDEGFTWYGGLYKSTDGGGMWNIALAGPYFGALAIDPRLDRDSMTPATVYAAGLSWDKGVFKSTDGGTTWSVASLPDLIGVLAIDPRTPTTLYAGVGREGALKSTDGGATWSAINTGLTDVLLSYGIHPGVQSLVIEPLTPATPPERSLSIYAGTSGGVFKSTDGGASWNPTGLFQHSPLVSLNVNPRAVFYGASSTGTVSLVTPAPEGGIMVSLSSSKPAIAIVPTSVTVPAGAASANFTISTNPDPWAAWGVRISATFDGVTVSDKLMVYATTLDALFLSPTTVPGGTQSTGTVRLWAPAPAGGATIPLSSSNPAVATVPASVTVPAGDTWANFAVSTSSVTASTAVTISAANYWAVLTVTPTPATTLSSVSFNPTGVTAGATSTGTVTLSAPAPAGGAAVALSSSNTVVATVPASVTVAAGATSGNFAVSTASCTSGSVTISGAYGGVTTSGVLTVTLGTTDTVTIQQADYFANRQELRVRAKSTSSAATLQILVTSSGQLIGTLQNLGDGKYSGQFPWPVNPQSISVRSSLCGWATSAVRSK